MTKELIQPSEAPAPAGASMGDMVKTTVHLRNMAGFPDYNRTYMPHFPGIRPVRTTVESHLAEGVMIEMDVIAYAGDI